MAMLSKVEDLIMQVNPVTRLHRGLKYLKDLREGRVPEVDEILRAQKPGETATVKIAGDWLHAVVQCYEARTWEQCKFEAHQRHTDLQYLCAGREWIHITDLRAQPQPISYDQNGNHFFPLGSQPSTRLLLQAGDVAVILPVDAHAPCLRVEDDQRELVRKVVVKVKDSLEAAA